MIRITYDPAKRSMTLANRGLDFADAERFFGGRHLTAEDDRQPYGERRFISVGELDGRAVVIVWTPRGDSRRVISMRHAHEKEARRWRDALDRS